MFAARAEARFDFRFARKQHGGEGEGAPAVVPKLNDQRQHCLLAIDQRHVAQIVIVKPNAIDSQRMYAQPLNVYRVQ